MTPTELDRIDRLEQDAGKLTDDMATLNADLRDLETAVRRLAERLEARS